MTEAKEQSLQEVFYGVKLSDVTDKMLEEIMKIYYGIAQIPPAPWRAAEVDTMVSELRSSNAVAFRIGSKYSMHSKLWVIQEAYIDDEYGRMVDRIVGFSFDPNTEAWRPGLAEEMQETQRQFKKATSDYLLQSGLGVALEPK